MPLLIGRKQHAIFQHAGEQTPAMQRHELVAITQPFDGREHRIRFAVGQDFAGQPGWLQRNHVLVLPEIYAVA